MSSLLISLTPYHARSPRAQPFRRDRIPGAHLRPPTSHRAVGVIRAPERPRETARRLVTSRHRCTRLTWPPAHNPVLARLLPAPYFLIFGRRGPSEHQATLQRAPRGWWHLRDSPPSDRHGSQLHLDTEHDRSGHTRFRHRDRLMSPK